MAETPSHGWGYFDVGTLTAFDEQLLRVVKALAGGTSRLGGCKEVLRLIKRFKGNRLQPHAMFSAEWKEGWKSHHRILNTPQAPEGTLVRSFQVYVPPPPGLAFEGVDQRAAVLLWELLPCLPRFLTDGRTPRQQTRVREELLNAACDYLEARGFEIEEAGSDGMSWQDAMDKAEKIRVRGESFTSYPKMAKRIGCSPSTLYKAIKDHGTVELQKWASKQHGASQLNVTPEAAAIAIETKPQSRERDPADITEEADIENTLAYLMDQAGPEERARINDMDPAAKRQLAETALRDPDREEQVMRYRRAKRSRRD